MFKIDSDQLDAVREAKRIKIVQLLSETYRRAERDYLSLKNPLDWKLQRGIVFGPLNILPLLPNYAPILKIEKISDHSSTPMLEAIDSHLQAFETVHSKLKTWISTNDQNAYFELLNRVHCHQLALPLLDDLSDDEVDWLTSSYGEYVAANPISLKPINDQGVPRFAISLVGQMLANMMPEFLCGDRIGVKRSPFRPLKWGQAELMIERLGLPEESANLLFCNWILMDETTRSNSLAREFLADKDATPSRAPNAIRNLYYSGAIPAYLQSISELGHSELQARAERVESTMAFSMPNALASSMPDLMLNVREALMVNKGGDPSEHQQATARQHHLNLKREIIAYFINGTGMTLPAKAHAKLPTWLVTPSENPTDGVTSHPKYFMRRFSPKNNDIFTRDMLSGAGCAFMIYPQDQWLRDAQWHCSLGLSGDPDKTCLMALIEQYPTYCDRILYYRQKNGGNNDASPKACNDFTLDPAKHWSVPNIALWLGMQQQHNSQWLVERPELIAACIAARFETPFVERVSMIEAQRWQGMIDLLASHDADAACKVVTAALTQPGFPSCHRALYSRASKLTDNEADLLDTILAKRVDYPNEKADTFLSGRTMKILAKQTITRASTAPDDPTEHWESPAL